MTQMLIPMFPDLTHDILEISVHHPSNRLEPLTVDTLLQRCIDDLLELRTFMKVIDTDVQQTTDTLLHGNSNTCIYNVSLVKNVMINFSHKNF